LNFSYFSEDLRNSRSAAIGRKEGLEKIDILKSIFKKVESRLFLPRNPQRATRNKPHHQLLKPGGEFRRLDKKNHYY
jgi:hypothetical protein